MELAKANKEMFRAMNKCYALGNKINYKSAFERLKNSLKIFGIKFTAKELEDTEFVIHENNEKKESNKTHG